MFHGKKIVVVMPAYNAARTIEKTYREIPLDLVDDVVVTDDASHDETVEIAARLGLHTLVHAVNRGYGGNQKTCYTEALRLGGDVVVMLHPDYQYTPRLIPAMVGMMTDGGNLNPDARNRVTWGMIIALLAAAPPHAAHAATPRSVTAGSA